MENHLQHMLHQILEHQKLMDKLELNQLIVDQWMENILVVWVTVVEPLVEWPDHGETKTREMFSEHFGWQGIVFDDDLADLDQAEIDLLGVDTVYDGRLNDE
jgi:hypothetical protein